MNTITKALAGAVTLATLMTGLAIAPASAETSAKKPFKVSLKSAKPQVAIGLKTNKIGRADLASRIRKQALAKGVRLSSGEVNQAASQGMGKLAAADNGPLKGIIHIKLKRITICIDWGKDQGHCG